MKNIFKYSPGFLAGVILSSAFAGAAAANSNLITNTIDQLWVFVAGDPVLASQVNENFEYLELKIEDNTSQSVSNSDAASQNASDIFANASNISSNSSALSTLSAGVGTNSSNIDFNSIDIADNANRIGYLENEVYSSLSYTIGDLIGQTWTMEFGGNVVPLTFTEQNGIYSPDPFTIPGTNGPETYTYYEGRFPYDMDLNLSFIFGDGTVFLFFEGWSSWRIFKGRMSADKTQIIGEYATTRSPQNESWPWTCTAN